MPLPPHFVGHTTQIHDLERDLSEDNVAHGYLLQGPASVGKFTIAKWFAAELLAQGADESEVESIRTAATKLLHSDILVIDLLWREDMMEDLDLLSQHSNISQAHRIKSGAKTDTISIDDVRSLQDRLFDIPERMYRCCLIKNVERFQDEAVNALLKVLEEPPKGLVFILTTSAPEHILPTLASRCRRITFSRLPRATLKPLVSGLDDDEAQFLLHMAQGAPGVIQLLKNNPERLREEHQLASNARAFWRENSLLTRMQLLAPLHERDAASERFLLHLALALRELPPTHSIAPLTAFRRFLHTAETNVSRPLLCAELALSSNVPRSIAQTRVS